MKIIDRFKAAMVRSLNLRDPQGVPFMGRASDAGEVVSESSVLALSAVWACTNLVAGTIGSLPLMVYEVKGGNREVAKDHPLYRLLHDSPNFDQTALDYWEFTASALELWGNAYSEITRSGGKVTGLSPINPDLVTVKRLKSGEIEYRWTQDGVARVETDENILHIRGFGGNPLGGMSTLHFGRNAFGLARAVDRSASGMFANGLRPSGVLTFENFLSAENREIAHSSLADQIGSHNASKPMILEGGTRWQQITINPEDAQMLESRKFSVEEICRFFGVPPHMVGHTENSTSWGTGLEQQTLGFQKFTLRRRLKRIEQALEKQLLTPADRANGVTIEFSLEGLLRGDSAARSAFYASGLMNGWMTINEVRAYENLLPVAGGEVPRMQMQNVAITEAGNDSNV